MTHPDRQTQWKSDTDALYRSIGKFVVEFEAACDMALRCICFILNAQGLTNQKIWQILFAGATAEPIRVQLESLVNEIKILSAKEQKIFNVAIKQFQALTSTRNDIVHSTWFVGYGNSESTDFKTATGMKYHRNKQGAVIKSFHEQPDFFLKNAAEAELLANFFLLLNGKISFGKMSLDKNYKIVQGRIAPIANE